MSRFSFSQSLCCPICRQPLEQQGGSLVCPDRHCFDIARKGYVNLLPVQQKKSLAPGDSREMLEARRKFLAAGHYLPVRERICQLLAPLGKGSRIVDIGCGEGWYTAGFAAQFAGSEVIGVDIARDALAMATTYAEQVTWITATAAHLPLADECADAAVAVFSLNAQEEMLRILKRGGRLVEVTAADDHLHQMKKIIYETVFEQHKSPAEPIDGLREISREELRFDMQLKNEQLMALLGMTPHINRIHGSGRSALEATERLELTAAMCIRVMEKCR